MTSVRFEDVSWTYELGAGHRALADVSLLLASGSFVAVTGVSGSGKTTLLRLLAGHAPHFFDGTLDGRVLVGDVDTRASSIADLSQSVGFVFENPYDQLTGATSSVFEEVAFGLENLGWPASDIRRRVDEVLGQVGAIDVRDRHPFQLSGGQTQRVAIASVLATSPDVLVLDEPTSQLDPMGSDEVLDVLIALQRAGATVLVATHDLDRFAPAADRLMILDAGSVVADGAPREVIGQLLESTMIRSPRVAQIFRQLQLRRRVPEDMPLALGIDEVVAALREAGA